MAGNTPRPPANRPKVLASGQWLWFAWSQASPRAIALTHAPNVAPCDRGCSGAIAETCFPIPGPGATPWANADPALPATKDPTIAETTNRCLYRMQNLQLEEPANWNRTRVIGGDPFTVEVCGVSSEGKTDREIRRCIKRSIGRHKLMAIRRQENRALLNDNESPAPWTPNPPHDQADRQRPLRSPADHRHGDGQPGPLSNGGTSRGDRLAVAVWWPSRLPVSTCPVGDSISADRTCPGWLVRVRHSTDGVSCLEH
jgi:hypothetical protein